MFPLIQGRGLQISESYGTGFGMFLKEAASQEDFLWFGRSCFISTRVSRLHLHWDPGTKFMAGAGAGQPSKWGPSRAGEPE